MIPLTDIVIPESALLPLLFALAFLLFLLFLALVAIIEKIHRSAARKRAIKKANKISEGLGGNATSFLPGQEIVLALKNKAIAYVGFPLAEGAEILYKTPTDSSDPSLFLAGHALVMVLSLEEYDEKAGLRLSQIASGFNTSLSTLYGKKGSYAPFFFVIANNASEAARVKNPVAKVVIGLPGLINELLRLARTNGVFDGTDGLNALYAAYPDVRLLMKEDRECDPRYEKGKMVIDHKNETIAYDPKEEGDSIYSFHLYAGRALQKGKKEG
jgi:hypothetical protein